MGGAASNRRKDEDRASVGLEAGLPGEDEDSMDMDGEGDWEDTDDLGLVPRPRPSSRPNMRKVVNLHKSYKAKGFDIHSIASPRESSHYGRDSSQDLRASSGSPLEEENVPPDSARTAERIKWKKGELIGCGSYGRVFLGLNQSTGQLMAVKQLLLPVTYKDDSKISNANRKRLAKIEHEINLLRSMSCPHIVNYYGVQLDRTNDGQKTLDIFLEFVPGGSIASLLTNFGKFGESIARVYTKQILLGLRYLHRHEIVHRDIKGANILVDPSGLCKLADFGASSFIAELVAAENPSINGTISWMAPEVIRQESHGNKVDIWSVGCTVVEMLTGKPPWCEFESGMAAMMHIAVTDQPPSLPCNLSSDGKDFVLRCFERDPRRRPSAAQLLRHPFVAEALDVVEDAKGERKVSTTTGSREGDSSLSNDGSSTGSEQTLGPAKQPPPRHLPPRHPQRAIVSDVQTSDTVMDAPTFSLGASNAASDIPDRRHEVPLDQPLVPVSNTQCSPALSEASAPSSADVTANVTISPNITFTPAASTQSSPDSPSFSLYSHQPHQSHQLRHSRHRSPPQGSHLLDDAPRLAHHQSPYYPPLGLVRSPKRGPETLQTSFRAPPSDFDLGPIETNRRQSRGPLDASEHDYRVQARSTSGNDSYSMHVHGDTGLESAGRLRVRGSSPIEVESGGGESVGGGSASRGSRPLLQSTGHDLIDDSGDGGRGSVEGLRVVLPPSDSKSSSSHMSPQPRLSGRSPNRLLQHSQQQQKGGEEQLLTDRAKYERYVSEKFGESAKNSRVEADEAERHHQRREREGTGPSHLDPGWGSDQWSEGENDISVYGRSPLAGHEDTPSRRSREVSREREGRMPILALRSRETSSEQMPALGVGIMASDVGGDRQRKGMGVGRGAEEDFYLKVLQKGHPDDMLQPSSPEPQNYGTHFPKHQASRQRTRQRLSPFPAGKEAGLNGSFGSTTQPQSSPAKPISSKALFHSSQPIASSALSSFASPKFSASRRSVSGGASEGTPPVKKGIPPVKKGTPPAKTLSKSSSAMLPVMQRTEGRDRGPPRAHEDGDYGHGAKGHPGIQAGGKGATLQGSWKGGGDKKAILRASNMRASNLKGGLSSTLSSTQLSYSSTNGEFGGSSYVPRSPP